MRKIFKKVLVPLDKSEASEKVVNYVACLASLFEVEKIVLLHVIRLSYLARHAEHVTGKLEKVEETEAFKRIKKVYYKEKVKPFLNRAKQHMISAGVLQDKIEIKIREGSLVDEVIREAENNYTSLVIKRGANLDKGIKIAKATKSIIHSLRDIAIFVVGEEKVDVKSCPMPKILVPIDGSSHSLRAVECAASLLKIFKEGILNLTLLYVNGKDKSNVMKKARKIFNKRGIENRTIKEKIRRGSPGKEIVKEAREYDYSTIIMGRRGLSKIQELLIGSVTKYVLENLPEATIVVV